MIDEREFQIDGRTFTVCYTARARYLFEVAAGYPVAQLVAFQGTLSDVELPRLVLAGLEGHRVRTKARKATWTLDEVLDDVLVDLDGQDRQRVTLACVGAVAAAFARAAGAPEAAEGAAGKEPTTA